MDLAKAFNELFLYHPNNVMLFNSGAFLFFFTFFLLGYSYLYQNKTLRTFYVLAFSFFFYYKSSGFYLGILLFTIVFDYWIGLNIYKAQTKSKKRAWLLLSVLSSLGLLAYFKYTNFILFNIYELFSLKYSAIDIFLPIGISFYTFQTLSYIIDIYRGEIEPTHNFWDYAFYMTFFPHLVAGPIVRAKFFLPQLLKPVALDKSEINEGLLLIIKGLIKKAIIADYISQYCDIVFGNPSGYGGVENLFAVYGYTLQIYCDFSGYSDIAIGIAKLLGYQLGDNFKRPYQSKNITEFWRKWHISLSFWLRDYVYIPMGGNRKGVAKQYLFLMLTMLIGGLWHGASWKFVFWGGMHGVGLAMHKYFSHNVKGKFFETKIWGVFSLFFTFNFVAFLWIFFRAADFATAWQMINSIIFNFNLSYLIPFITSKTLWVTLLVFGFATQFISLDKNPIISKRFADLPVAIQALIFIITVQLIIQLKSAEVQPFIYFQF
jgi:alginate O-acetyltransferase complex protein AlgI